MSRVSAKAPYFTTFRRRVRRMYLPYSPEVPSVLVEQSLARQLHEKKHSVVSNSWTDVEDPGDFMRRRPQRVMSVRYVTGGMRHGLGEYTELQPQVAVVEFTRAHNMPKPDRLPAGEYPELD